MPEGMLDGMSDTQEQPCTLRCGYASSGQDLINHERFEHQPCPECGAGADDGQDAIYVETSVSHRRDCPRLQPGYTYPDAGDHDDQAMGWL